MVYAVVSGPLRRFDIMLFCIDFIDQRIAVYLAIEEKTPILFLKVRIRSSGSESGLEVSLHDAMRKRKPGIVIL